jgi:hypothetical protein
MNKEMQVTGCSDCPFRDWETGNCSHPSILPYQYANLNVTPDWCPLKKESITISIKQ